LGHTRDIEAVRVLMQTPISGEITMREGPKGFMLLQGIEPNVDKMLKGL
jgi:hypothetical protein